MYISLNRKLMTCILRLCNSTTMTQIAMVNHIVCILFLITFTTALRTKQMSFCGRILLHRYYASNIRNIRQNQFFDKMRVVCTDLFLSHILCHMWQKHNMFQFYVDMQYCNLLQPLQHKDAVDYFVFQNVVHK